jgi:hypothetical protein
MKVDDLLTIKDWQVIGKNEAGKVVTEKIVSEKPDLLTGQLFKSRVLGFTEDKRVLLEINNRAVAVESRVPLKAGSELWLEVKGAGQSIFLSQAMKKGAVHEFIRQALPDTPAIKKTITSLVSFAKVSAANIPPKELVKFAPLFRFFTSLAGSGKQDVENLLEALIILGKTTQDFSPTAIQQQKLDRLFVDFLAMLQKQGENLPASMKDISRSGMERLLALIESLNQINSQPTAQGEAPFFLFPCFFAADAGWGEWMFNLEEDSEKGDKESASYQSLRFFLEMSRLGNVHLAVDLTTTSIRGTFFLEDEQAVAFVNRRLPDFEPILHGLGYEAVQFKCQVASRSLFQELKESLQQQAGITSIALLDVKV